MISLNEADHDLYESRLKYWRDDQARMAEQREEGFSKGFVLGRIQLLESLLGMASSPIGQFDSLSMDELLRMEADLKAKLANRP